MTTKTVIASLTGIGATKGTYQRLWNLSLNDEGRVAAEGDSAENTGQIAEGNYELSYVFDGQIVRKNVSFGEGRRMQAADEQQIVDEYLAKIKAITDKRQLQTALQRINARKDVLQASRSGEFRGTVERLKPSSLFPEDFYEEVDQLGSSLDSVDGELKVLSQITTAIERQLSNLK